MIYMPIIKKEGLNPLFYYSSVEKSMQSAKAVVSFINMFESSLSSLLCRCTSDV